MDGCGDFRPFGDLGGGVNSGIGGEPAGGRGDEGAFGEEERAREGGALGVVCHSDICVHPVRTNGVQGREGGRTAGDVGRVSPQARERSEGYPVPKGDVADFERGEERGARHGCDEQEKKREKESRA